MNDLCKRLPGIVAYPGGAQSSPFFAALASVLLPALGYTEETPYFCGMKEAYCIHCGECSDDPALRKHHMSLYHTYQTFTGVGFGWAWPESDSPDQVIPGWEPGWRWPDEFFRFIFGYAGLSWKRLRKGAEEEQVLAALKGSVDSGLPALLRLGMDWHVVTGYDNDLLIGLKHGAKEPAPIPGWFGAFEDAVIVSGRAAQSVTLRHALGRMIEALAHPAHARLEADLMARLDAVTPENSRQTAQWLLEIVGFPIEARWHAAECGIYFLDISPAVKDTLFGMLIQYIDDGRPDATHGTCWKIWAQFGVGPKTGYKMPPGAQERLLLPETRAELKRLFATVFENDRIVLDVLRKAAKMIDEEA